MAEAKLPAVVNPDADLLGHLTYLSSDTASVEEVDGGYRVKIFHSRGFPWEDVLKALLYRGFAVRVTNHKADLFIEAKPG